MAYAHVAHDCVIGNHCVLANNATLGGPRGARRLGDHGRLSGIHQFCKVGAHAFIAQQRGRHARRAALRDGGRPAGEPRTASTPRASSAAASRPSRSATSATRTALLYRSGLKLAEALAQLAALAQEQPELRLFVEFLPQSTRSIVR